MSGLNLSEQEEFEYLQLKAKTAAAQSAATPPKAESGGLDLQDIEGAGHSLLAGVLVGGGDEAVGAVRAALPDSPYDFGDDVSSETQSIGDAYKMYRDSARASRAEFQEENPGSAFALEMTGGVVSPINKVVPGAGMGERASVLTKAAASTGRGAVEGGIAGFLEGEGSVADRLASAKRGATVGGAFSAGLTGGGGLVGRQISKRRLADDIGHGDQQIPLNIADAEGSIGKFYRNVVGLGFGGRGALGKQESRYINSNPRLQRFADDTGRVVPDTVGTAGAINEVKDRVVADAATEADAIQRQIAGARPAPSSSTVTEATQAGLARTRAAMRTAQAKAAVPPHAPQELHELVATETDPAKVARALDTWWQKHGFAKVKEHMFVVDRPLKNFLLKHVDDENIIELLEAAEESGRPISGKWLMTLRNTPARASGTAGDYMRGALRQDVAGFDAQLRRIMAADGNTPALKEFNESVAYYGDKQAYVNAVDKARASPDGTAAFTEKHLNKAAPKRMRRYGEAPGQERSLAVIKQSEGLKQTIKAQRAADKARAAQQQSRLKNKKRRVGQKKRASLNRIERETTGTLPENSTFWSQAAATAGLGAIPSGLSAVGTLPVGYGVGRALASPSVQRAAVGQTDWQARLAQAMRRGDTAAVTRILSRQGALSATGEQ